nr:MAG TPA: ABC transporter ATP-binding protein [Caudoviricetes sp.]
MAALRQFQQHDRRADRKPDLLNYERRNHTKHMSRRNIRLFLLIMGIVYIICFWLHGRQHELVMAAIYTVGSLIMED